MAWIRAVGGRIKTDYRYSLGLCYNTFPFPRLSSSQHGLLGDCGLRILDAREQHSERTLAQLYNPQSMPSGLRDAHREAGRLTARLGIDHLFALGEHAEEVADGARAEGMDPQNIHTSRDWHEMGDRVRAQLGGRNRVLVKGSRAMRMERIVEHLVARDEQRDGREDTASRSGR